MMTEKQRHQVEEDFRRSHAELDYTAFTAWIHGLPEPLHKRLTLAAAISADLTEVATYFLELCAIRYTTETKATA